MLSPKRLALAVATLLSVIAAGCAPADPKSLQPDPPPPKPVRIEPPAETAITFFELSPDGKRLAYGIGEPLMAVVLCDTVTGKELHRLPDQGNGQPQYCRFSPDGGRLRLSWIGHVEAIWDPSKGAEIRILENAEASSWSPDGARLVGWKRLPGPLYTSPDLHVWDATTGKILSHFDSNGPNGWAGRCAFSADGRYMAMEHEQAEPLFDKDKKAVGKVAEFLPWRLHPVVDLWDVSTGKRRGIVGAPGAAVDVNTELWDADGHLVKGADLNAASHRKPRPSQLAKVGAESNGFRVRALPGGQYVLLPRYDYQPPPLTATIDRNGKTKIVSEPAPSDKGPGAPAPVREIAVGMPTLHLTATATGKELRTYEDFSEGAIRACAVSANGATLAALGNPTKQNDAPDKDILLIWDVSDLIRSLPRPPALTDTEFAALWGDLASDDAVPAHRAMRLLAAEPGRAAKLLAERLHPADASRMPHWIADLDSDDLDTREKASRELAQLDQAARLPLEKALANDPPAEARRRIAELLEKLKGPIPAEDLRGIRAADVLERIGTDAARKSLKALAGGAPGALVTQAARDALERLNDKP
jgi:WD40 repeat protein